MSCIQLAKCQVVNKDISQTLITKLFIVVSEQKHICFCFFFDKRPPTCKRDQAGKT